MGPSLAPLGPFRPSPEHRASSKRPQRLAGPLSPTCLALSRSPSGTVRVELRFGWQIGHLHPDLWFTSLGSGKSHQRGHTAGASLCLGSWAGPSRLWAAHGEAITTLPFLSQAGPAVQGLCQEQPTSRPTSTRWLCPLWSESLPRFLPAATCPSLAASQFPGLNGGAALW